MASIFFVRDGNGDDHMSAAHEVPVQRVIEKLRGRLKTFTTSKPYINVERGNLQWPYPYSQVVIEILTGETSPDYPELGFYVIHDLSPDECQKLFGIANQ